MKRYVAVVALFSAVAFADLAPMAPDERPSPAAQMPTNPALEHPEGIENVPMGVIQGGWGYVYAAYGVGLAGVLLYGLSLLIRRPEAKS